GRGRQVDGASVGRGAGRAGSRLADTDRPDPAARRTLCHAAAEAHRRSGQARRPGRGAPQEDGGGMEVTPGYKRTEEGVVREDWDCQSICDAAAKATNAIVGGPFGSDLVSADYVAAGVPVIRGQNMSERLVSGDFVFVSPRKAKSLSANLARPDDLVFTQR